MDRRSFIIGMGGLSAVGVGGVAPALAEGPATAVTGSVAEITLTIRGAAGATIGWADDQAYRVARAVELATDGRLRFVSAPNDTIADVEVAGADRLVALDPAFGYLAGLPGRPALDATDLMAWFNHGGGSALIDGLAQDLDVAVVPFGHRGTSKLWFRDDRPGSLAGRTVAVSGTGKAVARGLGASLLDGVDGGVAGAALADVVEASPLEVVTSGYLGHVRSVVDAAVTPRGTTLSLVFARPAWDRLPPDLQRAIQHTAERHYADAVAEDRVHADDILHGLVIEGFGLTVRLQRGTGADVEIDTIAAVAAAVIADVASGTPQARRIAASYDRFAALRRGRASYAAA